MTTLVNGFITLVTRPTYNMQYKIQKQQLHFTLAINKSITISSRRQTQCSLFTTAWRGNKNVLCLWVCCHREHLCLPLIFLSYALFCFSHWLKTNMICFNLDNADEQNLQPEGGLHHQVNCESVEKWIVSRSNTEKTCNSPQPAWAHHGHTTDIYLRRQEPLWYT